MPQPRSDPAFAGSVDIVEKGGAETVEGNKIIHVLLSLYSFAGMSVTTAVRFHDDAFKIRQRNAIYIRLVSDHYRMTQIDRKFFTGLQDHARIRFPGQASETVLLKNRLGAPGAVFGVVEFKSELFVVFQQLLPLRPDW